MQNVTMPKELYRQVDQVAQMLAELDAPVVDAEDRPRLEDDWEFGVDDEVFIGSLVEVKPDPQNYLI